MKARRLALHDGDIRDEERSMIKPFARGATLQETTLSLGVLVSFLARGQETDGRFAIMEVRAKQGIQAPPHIHQFEHEYLYVLEGEIEYVCEDEILTASSGQGVFLPQGRPHGPIIRSPSLHAIALVYASGEHPVGTDTMFLKTGHEVQAIELPQSIPDAAPGDLEQFAEIAAAAGVYMLTPDEVAARLPLYPKS